MAEGEGLELLGVGLLVDLFLVSLHELHDVAAHFALVARHVRATFWRLGLLFHI